jgi:isopentenyl diphosphate isomerase/L-lactate dehydrogenase-like FMN-dependent dehydrogenase
MLQTINSLFCATIIQHISEQANKPIIHKEDIKKLSRAQTQELVNFIKHIYGVPPMIDIESEVELRLNQIRLSSSKDSEFFPNILTQSGNYFFRNQSGMRGIQQQLALELSPWDEGIVKRLKGDRPW